MIKVNFDRKKINGFAGWEDFWCYRVAILVVSLFISWMVSVVIQAKSTNFPTAIFFEIFLALFCLFNFIQFFYYFAPAIKFKHRPKLFRLVDTGNGYFVQFRRFFAGIITVRN
jgi:hypothetical protein